MKRITLALTVLVMLFSVVAIQAQDDALETVDAVNVGAIIQVAASGSFVEAEDGAYTLTLEGVPAISAYYSNSPEVATGVYPVLELVDDWNTAEALVGTAVLQTEAYRIELSLTNPTYDFISVVNFDVEILEVLDLSENKTGVDVPESFEGASLFIELTEEFNTTLLAARDARLDAFRGTTVDCFPCGN